MPQSRVRSVARHCEFRSDESPGIAIPGLYLNGEWGLKIKATAAAALIAVSR